MQHLRKKRKFRRERNQRNALIKSLFDGLVLHEKIKTTEAKAKEIHSLIDKIINRAKEAQKNSVGQIKSLLAVKGKKTSDYFHRELGKIMWDKCGMARNDAGLKEALKKIPELREEFKNNVTVTGTSESLNQSLEKAGRVSDFLEFGELMCFDALHRTESCGGHFREESQTSEGEAKRKDDEFCFVSAWEHKGPDKDPVLHKEPLSFENVNLVERSYK